MQEHAEERKRQGVSRAYRNEAIEVKWEPEYCIHAGMCWRNLPRVFQPRNTPWVVLDGAAADEVARVVMLCPSGALSYVRLDGGPTAPVPAETAIEATPDGPLHLRGRLRIEDGMGNVIRETARAALCRCGQSANKPFCDGTHARIGFKSG